ncbi:hypothetical protein DPMN_099992 [Dreissena polymorpha]|uniref:Uncharacterized protein n=1 Tax=Dreissena polymorpha TaxID=45954 RepID=A0A9D4R8P8_DREPO|nr:hypothetical protein DPMN_099992 [Dreissena polymorpha]
MEEKRDKFVRNRAYKPIEVLSSASEYYKEYIMCCVDRCWASMWHIIALAHLLEVKIDVVYPAVNGTDNSNFKNINQVITPPFVDPEKTVITIMWSSMHAPSKIKIGQRRNTTWKTNHCVPLVQGNVRIEKVELVF